MTSVQIPGVSMGMNALGMVESVDTITARLAPILPGQTGDIPFQLSALYLKSAAPVDLARFGFSGTADLYLTVNCAPSATAATCGPGTGPWNIPQPDTLLPSLGVLNVTQNTPSTLVFTTDFPVYADMIFTPVGVDPTTAILAHLPAPAARQTSDPITASNLPNALPGTPLVALTSPKTVVLGELPEGLAGGSSEETFVFTLPFEVVPGQVIMGEGGSVPNLVSVLSNGTLNQSDWSDVVDFAAGDTIGTSKVTLYSDPELPEYCPTGFKTSEVSKPTYPGSPHSSVEVVEIPCPKLSDNAQSIPEIGPERSNGSIYRPGGNITYVFISDVPEPASWILFSAGFMGVLGLRSLRHGRK